MIIRRGTLMIELTAPADRLTGVYISPDNQVDYVLLQVGLKEMVRKRLNTTLKDQLGRPAIFAVSDLADRIYLFPKPDRSYRLRLAYSPATPPKKVRFVE